MLFRLSAILLVVTLASCADPGRERAEAPPHMILSDRERSDPLADRPLLPGDPAPPLAVAAWLRGRPVEALDPGQVYLINFWASWCAPCVASLAHLARLEERFVPIAQGRLTIVALTAIDPDNPRSAIERLLRERGAHMPAIVAIDRGTETTDAYRRAAREQPLPRAFVVDGEGRLAWIGHPKDAGGVLEEVLAGRWDLERARVDRGALLEHRRTARAALARLASGDRRAVAELAELPVEAMPFSPPWMFRVEHVDTLARGKRPEEAIDAAANALSDPAMASDPHFLAALAIAVRNASPSDADEYAAVALNTLEARDRAARRATDDPWLLWLRDAQARERGDILELLAEDAFAAERLAEGEALYRRAIEATEERFRAERERRFQKRLARARAAAAVRTPNPEP
jgi:thiol-disulfide isomerase/thioredoxin